MGGFKVEVPGWMHCNPTMGSTIMVSRAIRLLATFAAAVLAGVSLPWTGAGAVSVTNGSFEIGTAPGSFITLTTGASDITGWTVAGSIDYIGTYWAASNGIRSIDMNGFNSTGSISQTLTGLNPGQQYKVSFDLAGNPDSDSKIKTLAVTASAGSNSYSFDTTGATHSSMGWLTKSFIFTASGSTALLTFASTTLDNGPSYGPALDNVSITETPLPPALLLFGSALAGLTVLGRRKRQGVAT
jgi:choice-of-anchor C domain-containing protein